MTNHPLRIAYGDHPKQRIDVLAELLRNHGHELCVLEGQNDFLSAPEPDLYLLGRSIGDGTSGLDLLEALRRVGRSAPVLIVDERPSFDDMRNAIEHGAADIVLHPLEPGALAGAIARAVAARAPRPRPEGAPAAHLCERTYTAEEATVGRAAREASAFLVNEGIANAHRVRIATALAELVDNACRHAYAKGKGQITVRTEVQHSRVHVTVSDQGRGFDPARAKLERVPAPLPGGRGKSATAITGLGRIERLCEEHRIVSGPDGTRAELTFQLTPVRFDEEVEHLSETDFLDPTRARNLIAALRRGQVDLSNVAPGMALTIGRILGGLDAEIRPPTRK